LFPVLSFLNKNVDHKRHYFVRANVTLPNFDRTDYMWLVIKTYYFVDIYKHFGYTCLASFVANQANIFSARNGIPVRKTTQAEGYFSQINMYF